MFWMAIGNGAMMLCTVGIIRTGALSCWDAVYWGLLGTLVLTRYVDIRCYGGQTSTGDPATMTHFRTYALWLSIGTAALWGAAHGVAYLLSRL